MTRPPSGQEQASRTAAGSSQSPLPALIGSGGYSVRSAVPSDAPKLAALVDAAYRHYIVRIGVRPGPMTEDYSDVVRNRRVTVAETNREIVGVIVLGVTAEGFLIENVAVHPSHAGRGLGRSLLRFAEGEARLAGFDLIYLYTHEKMAENLALYDKLGYSQYDRRSLDGSSLVYLRKHIGASHSADSDHRDR